MTKVCFTCKNTNNPYEIHKINLLNTDDWDMIQENTKYFPNGLNLERKNIKIKKPRNANIKIKISMGNIKDRYVFYYAALPKKDPLLKFIEQKDAYDKLQNSGISKINNNGEAVLNLRCPQNYLDKGMWYPHVHFIISNKNNTRWMPNLYTRLVLCPVDKIFIKHAIQTDKYLILNALPMAEYIKEHIPHSLPLPYDSLKKLKDNDIIGYLTDMSVHSKSIFNYVNKKKENIFNIPIIVYCYNKKCNASNKVIERLWDMGFKNVKEYEGGITDWKK